MQLQKVSAYYNMLGSEIITVQKPMLLEPLLAFEKIVQEGAARKGGGGALTWADARMCADFVEALQRAAEKLSAQNRRLRALHAKLVEDVSSLASIDMLRQVGRRCGSRGPGRVIAHWMCARCPPPPRTLQRDAWRAKWSSIRESVAALGRSFAPEQMAKWLLHWDWQLYKVVECGYRMGLESLNENLGEIRVELTYTPGSRAPTFRPPSEEIRAQYYKEVRMHAPPP